MQCLHQEAGIFDTVCCQLMGCSCSTAKPFPSWVQATLQLQQRCDASPALEQAAAEFLAAKKNDQQPSQSLAYLTIVYHTYCTTNLMHLDTPAKLLVLVYLGPCEAPLLEKSTCS